jgi:hypothetical protein
VTLVPGRASAPQPILGDMAGTRPFAAVRETRSGVVFLVGDRAYKLKKPVDWASSASPRLSDVWPRAGARWS